MKTNVEARSATSLAASEKRGELEHGEASAMRSGHVARRGSRRSTCDARRPTRPGRSSRHHSSSEPNMTITSHVGVGVPPLPEPDVADDAALRAARRAGTLAASKIGVR